jgi:hypothetical protein
MAQGGWISPSIGLGRPDAIVRVRTPDSFLPCNALAAWRCFLATQGFRRCGRQYGRLTCGGAVLGFSDTALSGERCRSRRGGTSWELEGTSPRLFMRCSGRWRE